MTSTFNYTKCLDEFVYRDTVWNNYTTLESLKRIDTFQYRASDLCVATFPRSGTTLTQEIIWEIRHKDTISKDEKFGDIDDRFPFLEFNNNFETVNKIPWPIDVLNEQPISEKRLIKTHCPYYFIKNEWEKVKPKTVVVIRNPKDCAVSLYQFYKGLSMFGPWTGDWDEFYEIFMHGKTKCGNWFDVVLEWWKLRDKENIFILKYEDLVSSPAEQITKIAEFMEEPLTQEQLAIILHNTNFAVMSTNTNVNFTDSATGFKFLRKGKIGDWMSYFSEEQSRRMDEAVRTLLEPEGLYFQYE